MEVTAREMMGKHDVAVVEFFTGGEIRPKGEDVAVYAGSERVPSSLLAIGPGDCCRVAFEVSPGVTVYHVYYGNPAAANPYHWEPPLGLLLETRKYNGGDPLRLAAMERIARDSGPSFGADFVPQIFHGYNLFGPDEDFVSIYQGKLLIEEAGDYQFATSSDDASFFLIDGTPVAEKPGWGGAVNVPKFTGFSRHLGKGPHDVKYLHVQGKGQAICAAYWKKAREQTFQVIPPRAFPMPIRASASAAEDRGLGAAADIELAGQGLLWLDEKLLGRLALKDRSHLPEGEEVKRLWDFGDGVLSTDPDPEHVYLHAGEVAATLTIAVGGRKHAMRQRFLVGPGWPCQLQQQEMDAAKYAAIASSYDPERLSLADALTGIELFEQTGRAEDILRWSRAVFLTDKREQLSQAQWMRYGVPYARLLREHGSAEQSDQLLTVCLAVVKEPMSRARLLAERGNTKLLFLRRPAEAAEDFLAVLKLQGDSKDDLFRLAQVRLGDMERQKGQLAAARAEYDKAAALRSAQVGLQSAIKLGAYQQSIEQYLLANELDAAEDLLDTWEWERPHDKLEGETTLLRARLDVQRKRYPQAIQEAEDLIRVNPASGQAPQLLLLESDAWKTLGQPAKAKATLERLLKEYPEAAEQQDARRTLKELGE